MSRYGETYLEIRKLRKKLRQIENLETLERDLDQFEVEKVNAKPEFRARLLELIASEASGNEDETEPEFTDLNAESYETSTFEQGFIEEDESNKTLEDSEDAQESREAEVKTQSQERLTTPDVSHPAPVKKDLPPAVAKPSTSTRTPEEPPAKKAKQASSTKPKKEMKNSQKFLVRTIEGHNDLVTCVAINEDLFVSGSRDTTLKVWSVQSGLNVSHLGGHTSAVTAVLLIDPSIGKSIEIETEEAMVISGSSDCSVRLWRTSTGECIKSIYVFNPVVSLSLLQVNDSNCLLIGSAGGKLEMWSLTDELALQSFRTEEKAVTGIDVEGHHVFTSSASGLIRVYELRNETLHLIYESENAKLPCGSLCSFRPIHCVGVSHQMVYYGDDGMNLKVLDWRNSLLIGKVNRLSHHNIEFGVTDAIKTAGGQLILASGFDLDNGVGYVNENQSHNGQILENQPFYGPIFENQLLNGQTIENQPLNGPIFENQLLNGQILENQPLNGPILENQPRNGQILENQS
ncbi:hypothetical protein CAPTEDRAFT_209463 [Capitella teleta]|uniref:Uncharacterized protein n=1 Tax=Capitella teleta TaxID=283909 RepID=R7UML1_CAPTE|nr:hypothetical protein CAPTEDRAFT_209463 [Capitella teleta]|eukprot:ELU07460.1 hypothetical protein CAPTEDRAFT_209463 [Capitella teleta]